MKSLPDDLNMLVVNVVFNHPTQLPWPFPQTRPFAAAPGVPCLFASAPVPV